MAVSSVCTHGDYVIVLVHDATGYYTHLYKQKTLLSHSSVKKNVTSYLSFPYSDNTQTELNNVSLYVIVSDAIEYSPYINSQCMKISDEFFKRLFTSEIALMNSPVILFCAPNGSAYFAASKSGSRQDGPTTSWKVLCHTSQRIVSIHSITVPSKSNTEGDENRPDNIGKLDEKSYEGLLFCAKDGKCTLILHSKRHSIKYKSCLVSSPLIASDCCADKFYHSTGREMIETTLSLMYANDELTLSAQNPTFLTCGNVAELMCLKNPVGKGSCDSLLCRLGDDNKVKVVKSGTSLQKWQTTYSLNQGGRIKDLLISLENTTSKKKQISLASIQINQWLSQLSIASFLIRSASISEHPIRCNITINHERMEATSCQPILSCVLFNQGPFQLSSDWSILIVMATESSILSSTKCLNLRNGLKQKESIEVALPINMEAVYHSLVKIDVSLCLKIGKMPLKDLCVTLPEWKQGSLVIIVCECMVDIFHFLQVSTNPVKSERRVSMLTGTCNTLLKMAKTCPLGQHVQLKSESASEIITIHIELDVPVLTKRLTQNRKELNILRFLLKNSQIKLDQICENNLTLKCVTADWKIQLEVNVTDKKGEITVKAPVAIAAVARQAVLHRIQIEQATGGKVMSTYVPTVKLGQELLCWIQMMKKQVCMLIDNSSAKSIEDNRSNECLGSIYEKCRYSSCKLTPVSME